MQPYHRSTEYTTQYAFTFRIFALTLAGLSRGGEALENISLGHGMTVPSCPLRLGSGALVSQPSSQARATALTLGNLPEPIGVKAR